MAFRVTADRLDSFVPAVAALGSVQFAGALLAGLNKLVPVDHVCLMRFDDTTRAPVLESATWRGGEHVPEVQRAYLGGLFRHDPNLALAREPALRRGPRLTRLTRTALGDTPYRHVCYDRAGIRDRLTIATLDASRLYCLNLYRGERGGGYGAAEIEVVRGVTAFLAALSVKHGGMVGALLRSRDRADRVDALLARLHALEGSLTRRECEVLARVLLGMTSEGIALDLGIALNSVLTYRKRAYARLGISSQAQLFSLCLR